MSVERELFFARQRFSACQYPPLRAALWAEIDYLEGRLNRPVSRA